MDICTKEELVTFGSMSPVYPPESDITIQYTLGPHTRADPLDRIGIFQSGCGNYKHPLTCQYVPPQPNSSAQSAEGIITFPATFFQAVADTKKMYQCIYLNQCNQVLGASQLFQFIADAPKERKESSSKEQSHDTQLVNQDNNLTYASTSSELLTSEEEWEVATEADLNGDLSCASSLSDIVILSVSPAEIMKLKTISESSGCDIDYDEEQSNDDVVQREDHNGSDNSEDFSEEDLFYNLLDGEKEVDDQQPKDTEDGNDEDKSISDDSEGNKGEDKYKEFHSLSNSVSENQSDSQTDLEELDVSTKNNQKMGTTKTGGTGEKLGKKTRNDCGTSTKRAFSVKKRFTEKSPQASFEQNGKILIKGRKQKKALKKKKGRMMSYDKLTDKRIPSPGQRLRHQNTEKCGRTSNKEEYSVVIKEKRKNLPEELKNENPSSVDGFENRVKSEPYQISSSTKLVRFNTRNSKHGAKQSPKSCPIPMGYAKSSEGERDLMVEPLAELSMRGQERGHARVSEAKKLKVDDKVINHKHFGYFHESGEPKARIGGKTPLGERGHLPKVVGIADQRDKGCPRKSTDRIKTKRKRKVKKFGTIGKKIWEVSSVGPVGGLSSAELNLEKKLSPKQCAARREAASEENTPFSNEKSTSMILNKDILQCVETVLNPKDNQTLFDQLLKNTVKHDVKHIPPVSPGPSYNLQDAEAILVPIENQASVNKKCKTMTKINVLHILPVESLNPSQILGAKDNQTFDVNRLKNVANSEVINISPGVTPASSNNLALKDNQSSGVHIFKSIDKPEVIHTHPVEFPDFSNNTTKKTDNIIETPDSKISTFPSRSAERSKVRFKEKVSYALSEFVTSIPMGQQHDFPVVKVVTRDFQAKKETRTLCGVSRLSNGAAGGKVKLKVSNKEEGLRSRMLQRCILLNKFRKIHNSSWHDDEDSSYASEPQTKSNQENSSTNDLPLMLGASTNGTSLTTLCPGMRLMASAFRLLDASAKSSLGLSSADVTTASGTSSGVNLPGVVKEAGSVSQKQAHTVTNPVTESDRTIEENATEVKCKKVDNFVNMAVKKCLQNGVAENITPQEVVKENVIGNIKLKTFLETNSPENIAAEKYLQNGDVEDYVAQQSQRNNDAVKGVHKEQHRNVMDDLRRADQENKVEEDHKISIAFDKTTTETSQSSVVFQNSGKMKLESDIVFQNVVTQKSQSNVVFANAAKNNSPPRIVYHDTLPEVYQRHGDDPNVSGKSRPSYADVVRNSTEGISIHKLISEDKSGNVLTNVPVKPENKNEENLKSRNMLASSENVNIKAQKVESVGNQQVTNLEHTNLKLHNHFENVCHKTKTNKSCLQNGVRENTSRTIMDCTHDHKDSLQNLHTVPNLSENVNLPQHTNKETRRSYETTVKEILSGHTENKERGSHHKENQGSCSKNTLNMSFILSDIENKRSVLNHREISACQEKHRSNGIRPREFQTEENDLVSRLANENFLSKSTEHENSFQNFVYSARGSRETLETCHTEEECSGMENRIPTVNLIHKITNNLNIQLKHMDSVNFVLQSVDKPNINPEQTDEPECSISENSQNEICDEETDHDCPLTWSEPRILNTPSSGLSPGEGMSRKVILEPQHQEHVIRLQPVPSSSITTRVLQSHDTSLLDEDSQSVRANLRSSQNERCQIYALGRSLTNTVRENIDLKREVEHLETQLKNLNEFLTDQSMRLQHVGDDELFVTAKSFSGKVAEHKKSLLPGSKGDANTLLRSHGVTRNCEPGLRDIYVDIAEQENEINNAKKSFHVTRNSPSQSMERKHMEIKSITQLSDKSETCSNSARTQTGYRCASSPVLTNSRLSNALTSSPLGSFKGAPVVPEFNFIMRESPQISSWSCSCPRLSPVTNTKNKDLSGCQYRGHSDSSHLPTYEIGNQTCSNRQVVSGMQRSLTSGPRNPVIVHAQYLPHDACPYLNYDFPDFQQCCESFNSRSQIGTQCCHEISKFPDLRQYAIYEHQTTSHNKPVECKHPHDQLLPVVSSSPKTTHTISGQVGTAFHKVSALRRSETIEHNTSELEESYSRCVTPRTTKPKMTSLCQNSNLCNEHEMHIKARLVKEPNPRFQANDKYKQLFSSENTDFQKYWENQHQINGNIMHVGSFCSLFPDTLESSYEHHNSAGTFPHLGQGYEDRNTLGTTDYSFPGHTHCISRKTDLSKMCRRPVSFVPLNYDRGKGLHDYFQGNSLKSEFQDEKLQKKHSRPLERQNTLGKLQENICHHRKTHKNGTILSTHLIQSHGYLIYSPTTSNNHNMSTPINNRSISSLSAYNHHLVQISHIETNPHKPYQNKRGQELVHSIHNNIFLVPTLKQIVVCDDHRWLPSYCAPVLTPKRTEPTSILMETSKHNVAGIFQTGHRSNNFCSTIGAFYGQHSLKGQIGFSKACQDDGTR